MRAATPAVLALLLVAAVSPGCITDPVTGRTVLGMPLSDADEIEMGNGYYPSFRSQYEGAYPDPALEGYLGGIVLGIARSSHRPDLPWTFTMLNSSEVNAFALPGGNVCITRGLLVKLENEAQFAGVMGHEVGHVCHKHAAQGMGQQAVIGLVVAGLAYGASESDSDAATIGATLGAVGGQLLMLSYSRDHEYEADQRGVEYSAKGGWDPREMAGVFEIFKQLKGGGGGIEWLSTHPLDDKRIAAVDEEVRTRYPRIASADGAGFRKSSAEWDFHLARLRAAQEVYDEYDEVGKAYAKAVEAGDRSAFPGLIRRLQECERRLPGHALFTSGVGVVRYRMGDERAARTEFERAAALQPDLFEPHAYLGRIALASSDLTGLLRHGRRAAELFPHHPLGHYLTARGLDAQGDAAGAEEHYRAVLSLAPEESEEYAYAKSRMSEIEAARAVSGASYRHR